MSNTLEGLCTSTKNSATITSTVAFIHALALFFLLSTSPFKPTPKPTPKIAVRTVQLTKQTVKRPLQRSAPPEQLVAVVQEQVATVAPEPQVEQLPDPQPIEEAEPKPKSIPKPSTQKPATPKPTSKPAPKPVAKPKSKPAPAKPKTATKKPTPVQKESAEKKKKEQEVKSRQEKEQRERQAKQNALVQDALSALNKAKSADKKRAATASGSGSYQKSGPKAIDSLASESLVCIQATDEVLVGREKTYYDELVQRLKLHLKLPDHGDVKIHLTLSKLGKVLKVDCKSAKSSKNAAYLQKTLPTVVFPSFGSSFSGEESHTFHFHFANELSY